jgi:hypothetical protein
MTSHTHKRGQHFRVWDPAGNQIYDSVDYSNPSYVTFQPAIALDSDSDAGRTMKFCSVFNNGLDPSGAPDFNLLTQVSQTPSSEVFKPAAVACSKGKWGTPCIPLFGDAQCDTTTGAGDGKCDAANIHFGETTASEMFLWFVDIVNPNQNAGAAPAGLLDSVAFGTPLPNVDVK